MHFSKNKKLASNSIYNQPRLNEISKNKLFQKFALFLNFKRGFELVSVELQEVFSETLPQTISLSFPFSNCP